MDIKITGSTKLSLIQCNMTKFGDYTGLLTFTDKYPPVGYNIIKFLSLPLGLVIEVKYVFDYDSIVDDEEPDIYIKCVNFNTCDRFGICVHAANENHFDRLELSQQVELIKMFNELFEGIHIIDDTKVPVHNGGDMFG